MTQIRHAGYAIEGEEEIGCRCIGAPVFDHSGNVIAAIGVAARRIRSDISDVLGFTPVKIESSGQ